MEVMVSREEETHVQMNIKQPNSAVASPSRPR
jgi:hypothetical protein